MTPSPTLSVGDFLVVAQGLCKDYPVRGRLWRKQWRRVVDHVSFEIRRGSTLALVGESGSGKTTVGLMLLDLIKPTAGQILYNGLPYSARSAKERRALRREIQVVFQDPYSSLNARMNIREILTEGMVIHRIGANAREREERAAELLKQVSMSPDALDRYPHEFSGGQRQRIAIARALSVEPKFLVLDEPTSALDVSVQSQVLNLLCRLQRERNLTYLFISHNLDVVSYLAEEVIVMERGRIVERGAVEQVFGDPQHPYTRNLLEAIPSLDKVLAK
ncbi:MAG TPA: ATP-binding cassette domain-containing protein [Chthonomonas sp.]|jgi:ABC-type oligopeptide transport system ATPase subunit|uniref:ATP-binding cassette domain-containing protein n=1 Tax=Chthonomonas sp. TaxID=2282153 RepID=UPI002B4B7E1A|nr:ATP-binding cassette domain-containing protein [Chthonomonas sp.]HLH80726.1 ATP-binding cassette domain-containing protein [Chthonomonas sp.]